MISLLLAIVLGLLALAYVLYPLYSQAKPGISHKRNSSVSDEASVPTEQEQSARTALQEIELDYQLGNISQEEYRRLRERYIQRALVGLKSHYEREQELDEEIEAQLRSMKEHDNNANDM
ncbi:MAG: hypothetical protein JO202_12255 [Ktedonobacteraceae bacterium]|nr:hypothetical protein [Ktedonobacteraceae bacterium]